MVDYTLGRFKCQVVGWVESGGLPLETQLILLHVYCADFLPFETQLFWLLDPGVVVGWVESGGLPLDIKLFWFFDPVAVVGRVESGGSSARNPTFLAPFFIIVDY